MPDQISGDNSAVAAVDNSATGHTDVTNGTSPSNGQPDGQSGPADDLFKGIDPQKLPPELRPHLDSMVRTYREKTQKLSESIKAETEKATAAFKQKAEWYDQAVQDEKLVKMINEYVQKAGQPDPAADPIQQKLQEMERRQSEIDMKVRTTEALEILNAFADAKNEKGEKLHPDFDELSSFKIGTHTKAGEYDLLRACIELAPGNSPQEKMEAGYKAAKAVKDAIFEAGKKAGMGRLQAKAQNGSFSPTGVVGNTSGVAPHKAKNALEALQFARRGLAPAQD